MAAYPTRSCGTLSRRPAGLATLACPVPCPTAQRTAALDRTTWALHVVEERRAVNASWELLLPLFATSRSTPAMRPAPSSLKFLRLPTRQRCRPPRPWVQQKEVTTTSLNRIRLTRRWKPVIHQTRPLHPTQSQPRQSQLRQPPTNSLNHRPSPLTHDARERLATSTTPDGLTRQQPLQSSTLSSLPSPRRLLPSFSAPCPKTVTLRFTFHLFPFHLPFLPLVYLDFLAVLLADDGRYGLMRLTYGNIA